MSDRSSAMSSESLGAAGISPDDLNKILEREFPQSKVRVEALSKHAATVRHPVGSAELRPGGTVSGPVMFAAADCALYAAILGELGLVTLAVTTNLNINFLRKPSAEHDIIAKCSLIKIGTRLVVGEVSLFSEGSNKPVAHAVGSYSIPPKPNTPPMN